MSERLVGPRAKIKRAQEHIADLDAEIGRFIDTEPYLVVPEEDPETGDRVYRIRVRGNPPDRCAVLLGDVLHNLRSALDLLAWQLVDANGQIPDNERQRQRIGFPISESAEEFEASGLRKVEGASKEAKDVLRAISHTREGMTPSGVCTTSTGPISID